MTDSALTSPLSGEDRHLDTPHGALTVRVAGTGDPMLLVHSINATASGAEVAPMHEWAQGRFRVYTPDLPGYGRSERDAGPYTPERFAGALGAVVDLMQREVPGRGIHGLGLSLSAEFLVRTVLEKPTAFASLALVTPTGFNRRAARSMANPEDTRLVRPLSKLFAVDAVGRGAFQLLTRPGVIRYFLQRTFGSKDIDEDLWRYACRTAREPGARHAPLAFLSGGLFSANPAAFYRRLALPVWLGHGTRGDFADFSGARWVEDRSNWRRDAFATGALPWFEVRDAFIERYEAFLESL